MLTLLLQILTCTNYTTFSRCMQQEEATSIFSLLMHVALFKTTAGKYCQPSLYELFFSLITLQSCLSYHLSPFQIPCHVPGFIPCAVRGQTLCNAYGSQKYRIKHLQGGVVVRNLYEPLILRDSSSSGFLASRMPR